MIVGPRVHIWFRFQISGLSKSWRCPWTLTCYNHCHINDIDTNRCHIDYVATNRCHIYNVTTNRCHINDVAFYQMLSHKLCCYQLLPHKLCFYQSLSHKLCCYFQIPRSMSPQLSSPTKSFKLLSRALSTIHETIKQRLRDVITKPEASNISADVSN